ncbi:NAD-dependent epimerase/dehydratase family protein [Microbacterium sp. WCS2018Hpa-9]|uniref:NAD-dependent epimerase/dehydratase family protein n=1 Tax=Microbacterium sp. WCS2018Hpa-9 TaxID=3073635 RepID=UPI0028894C51|nr:NAD-dependent epimerase/dehydratase family protein [Microbacterium sp. WCS2018Hpa-9]
MPTSEWIIGRGLLGSAIISQLEGPVFTTPVTWGDTEQSRQDLSEGLSRFIADTEGRWSIYWCAGRGVTSTPREVMLSEAEVFRGFLEDISALPGDVLARGHIFLASSVGGAYAGSASPPFTEDTVPVPLSAYGETKLSMEQSLREAAERHGFRGFIARITNLYGPGQDLGKGQGLISVIVESYVTGRPVSIYVPLDTLRDYIYVDDCATVIVAGMRRLAAEPSGRVVTKIVGAMDALSIGAIMGEMSRLRRKPVPLVTGQGNSTGQASDLRVRSIVWPELDSLVSTTLPAGLGAIYRAQLAAHILPT